MENRLCLHVPALSELWYRKQLMEDPATMDYNRGYNLPFDGYHPETGCIDFPEGEWADWHAYFIGQEPERFYAYVMRKADGVFIGEVNIHRNPDALWHDMGVVIEGRYRGMGYGKEALSLLLAHAFEGLHADAVHNDFEDARSAAVRVHRACGFTEFSRENGVLELLITREQYEKRNVHDSVQSDHRRKL